MDRNVSSFTVCFQPPFWVGIAEQWTADGYEAARVVFGPEPSDAQIYQWLGGGVAQAAVQSCRSGERARVRPENPKRVRREARKTLESSGAGTRAQQALAREREQAGERLRRERRQRRLQSEEERFRLRQQKKREKKRGGDAPGPEGRGRSPAALRHENR